MKVLKLGVLGGLSLGLWLLPASTRLPRAIQGISLSVALACAIEATRESRKAILSSALATTAQDFAIERQALALALHHEQQSQQIYSLYGMAPDPQQLPPAQVVEPVAVSATPPQLPTEASTSPERVLDAELLLNYPAVLVYGPQGSGKTSFTTWLIRQRQMRGEIITVLDPHVSWGQWAGCHVIGDGMDYEAIEAEFKAFHDRIRHEYQSQSKGMDSGLKAQTTVIEEFTNMALRCQSAGEFFQACLSDSRKTKERVVFVSHSRTLAGLGNARGFAATRDAGLLEIELEADTSGGTPTPAFRGKLKLPGQEFFPVIIPPWMYRCEHAPTISANRNSNLPEIPGNSGKPEWETGKSRLEASFTDSGNFYSDADFPIYQQIKQALLSGKNISQIITDVLGYRGRNYQEGKDKYQQIIAKAQEYGW